MSSVSTSASLSTPATSGLAAWAPTVARTVYAVPYLVFGLFHLTGAQQMAGMVPVPGGVFWVYVTGVAMIAAAVSFLANRLTAISAPLLALLLVTYVVTLHLPMVGDPAQGQMAMISLLKDLSLAGGALMVWADALRAKA